MNAVNQFKSDNPDLTKHEKIVQAFVGEQPSNLSTANRLKRAGDAAREYLKGLKVDLKAGDPNPAPKGGDYVESPTQRLTPALPLPKEDEEGEAQLLEYIAEKGKETAAHFGK
jgi:hypothetical protein